MRQATFIRNNSSYLRRSYSYYKGNKVSAVGDTRILWVGGDYGRSSTVQFPSNRIVTSKYTIWSFLPKNLFEQFRRVANFYFLCMSVIAVTIDSPVEPLTSVLPLIFVIFVTSLKQGYEDWLRHRSDNEVNCSLVTVIRKGIVQDIKAKDIHVGDLIRVVSDADVPCDLVLLSSSHTDGRCYITTANLDGETNLKTLVCPRLLCNLSQPEQLARLNAQIECEQPTSDLYKFSGKIELFPNEANTGNDDNCVQKNLLLRGARLKNTEFVIGCAVYTGQETKLALNSKLTSNKFSTVEKSINSFLLFFLLLLVTEVAVSIAFKYAVESDDKYKSYLGPQSDTGVSGVIQDLFSFVILYNYIIPISLYVTVEMQKFFGSLFFKWDKELYCEKIDQPAICNTSDLNEELGQVEYLFTDKTGTLTENNMWFRRCSVAGIPYLEDGGRMFQLLADGDKRNSILMDTFTPDIEHFLLALALCHSVQVGMGRGHTNNNTDTYPISSLDYQASSPDEKALVEASARCGVVFLGEEGECMSVMVKGRVCHYRKLNTLEFTSDRKRMSVIVQDKDGQIWLYCKGAESSIIPLTEAGPVHDTLQHVADFALRGLRTLVVCYRKLSVKEYSQLASHIAQSRQTLSSKRASVIAESYQKMEHNLTLLGATGVEDQLQDGVQETLESLRAAGIKVWILTGDKVETAVNISLSCGHLKPSARQLYLTGHTAPETCLQTLDTHRNQVSREPLEHYGLVVDGQSLSFALTASEKHLEAFQDVCRACTSVICCRMSPLQKCQVVQLVKGFPERPITAAIGDGANDVSMIQEAHVGLGIMGKEGWQAVRCSDFAFARFKFLRRVLLVHGHWYYIRVANLVQYFFYKNIVFIIPQLYYAFSNVFSTQPLYDTMFLTLYNVLFTSLPVLVYGLFEQNHSAQTLLDYPQLYSNNRRNVLMSWSSFFQWMAFGVWHSVVLYFIPYFMLLDNPVVLYNNTSMEMVAFGTFIFHCVVCVANLKLVLRSHYWTWLFLGSALLVTICGFILVTAVYSIITTASMAYVYPTLLGSCTFWLLSVVLIVACLVPDCTFNVLQRYTPAASAKLKKIWRRAFGKKTHSHYSFNRSSVQRRSSGHAADRRESGISVVSCRSIS
ncbi:hypothetical protein Cfor_10512 [Coptotermes formosanus]|uniref:Phospholipid-transporting ATPase n=1 Tax=Coptotermes formosanus TaxID=36987 RepID=A0A6L2PGL3_COPFO|nr:hypothetical protein Cfor_10512 [Coptotermes formosanus]